MGRGFFVNPEEKMVQTKGFFCLLPPSFTSFLKESAVRDRIKQSIFIVRMGADGRPEAANGGVGRLVLRNLP